MSDFFNDGKQDLLGEILMLLHEQDRSSGQTLTTGEEHEYALRAKRINDLLEEMV